MNEVLSHDALFKLREANIITNDEVAYSVGDKYVAENVISKARRIIQVPKNIIENKDSRRVLKG